ncbi:SLC13 family permease [Stappia sp. F7233]|uniref:SLC13 family permease n=1 Tax=Stappia albiluteola TaxID=2758565 RepID=A0A839ADX0_9HYPH|nr:SLC13 family permease [Stappia albiluteola]MBA5777873.1 SLC13 family permease [Stappia albiluteola]
MIPFIAEHQALFGLAVLGLVFAGFALERYPPEVVAVGGAALMLCLGLLDVDEALSVFSNAAPITIAAMFMLSGALVRTGTLEAATSLLMQHLGSRKALAMLMLLLATLVLSGFVNNTPVVIVLIPVVIRLAGEMGDAPSSHLIPLSFAGILGGTCTLIGTSTNLLVDGVSQSQGLAPFGIFEIAPIGIVVAAVGMTYLLTAGRFLLPKRTAMGAFKAGSEAATFTSELVIPADSDYVGKKLGEVSALDRSGITLYGAIGRSGTLSPVHRDMELKAGDRISFSAPAAEVLTLHQDENVVLGEPRLLLGGGEEEETILVEALAGPDRRVAGRTVRQLALPYRYGAAVIGVHRHRAVPAGTAIADLRLQSGDTLILAGTARRLTSLAQTAGFVSLSEPTERPYRRRKAPIAIATIAAVVLLAAFNVLPIAGLAMIGVAFILLTRCIDSDEAFQAIDGRVLILIFAMLAVGRGLEEAGAVELIVDAAMPFLKEAHPLLILAVVYLLASLLTELVTNNAVAVVFTPIAIGLAQSLGLDPRSFVMAVMFGASASFATPIGYQTNTLVYGAGNYRFLDFVRIGLPLNILAGATAVAMIYLVFGLGR